MPRPRKFEERDVVEAARDAFWRDGYAATSVNDLARATGLGPQSLYGAFGSKHDLFVRVLDEYCAVQAAGLEAALTADPNAWHGVASAVAFEDGGRLDLPAQGCLMANSAAALSSSDDEVRDRARAVYCQTQRLFVDQLNRARDAGEVNHDIDPVATARALVAVMQGVEFLRKSGIDEAEFEQVKTAVLSMISSFTGAADNAPNDVSNDQSDDGSR